MIHRNAKATAKLLNQSIDELTAEVKRLQRENAELQAKKPAANSISITFTQADHENLSKIVSDLGVPLGTFVITAINRRIQDLNDFKAVLNRCLHLAAGEDRLCVMCGETVPD